MQMQGQLVRILGGRMWELLTEEGHVGLEGMLREYEGKRVRVTIVEVKEKTRTKKGAK